MTMSFGRAESINPNLRFSFTSVDKDHVRAAIVHFDNLSISKSHIDRFDSIAKRRFDYDSNIVLFIQHFLIGS